MPVPPTSWLLPILIASGMATAIAQPGPSAEKKARFSGEETKAPEGPATPPNLLARVPTDLRRLCGAFMDEASLGALTATSSTLHRYVEDPRSGLRWVSRRHNRNPMVLDFDNPKNLFMSYKGHRSLELINVPDDLNLTCLDDNVEVEAMALVIHGDIIMDEVMQLRSFPALTSLTLDVRNFENGEPKELARTFLQPARRLGPMAALTSLTIDSEDHDVGCWDLDLTPLLAGCSLQSLDLGGCPVSRSGTGTFADHLYRLLPLQAASLRSLTLNVNNLGGKDAVAMCRALDLLPGLRHLTLRDNHLCNHRTEKDLRRLGSALARMGNLETLNLEGIQESYSESGECLLLNLPPSLRHLENMCDFLDYSRSGDSALPEFVAAMERLPALQRLTISQPLRLEDAQRLAKALAAKPELQHLGLWIDTEEQPWQLIEDAMAPLVQAFTEAGRTLELTMFHCH